MNRKQVLAAVIGVGAVTTGAAAQNAVQWRVEDGGNGHWYLGARASQPVTWSEAQEAAHIGGGSLASLGTAAESDWVYDSIASDDGLWENFGPYFVGPWIGARGPSGKWRWEDGTPWNFSIWYPGEGPPTADPTEQFAHYFGGYPNLAPSHSWGDYFDVPVTSSYIIEWSADCNSDGIVDYGQILSGELEDTNSNGVPDCCDAGTSCDCPADIDGNGDINGIDLAIILDKWGTNGGKDYPNADIDGDGTIAGADLAQVLGNWGACQ